MKRFQVTIFNSRKEAVSRFTVEAETKRNAEKVALRAFEKFRRDEDYFASEWRVDELPSVPPIVEERTRLAISEVVVNRANNQALDAAASLQRLISEDYLSEAGFVNDVKAIVALLNEAQSKLYNLRQEMVVEVHNLDVEYQEWLQGEFDEFSVDRDTIAEIAKDLF